MPMCLIVVELDILGLIEYGMHATRTMVSRVLVNKRKKERDCIRSQTLDMLVYK